MLLTIAYYRFINGLYNSRVNATAWDHNMTKTRAHVIDSGPVDEVLDPSRRDEVGRFVNAAFDWPGNGPIEKPMLEEQTVL